MLRMIPREPGEITANTLCERLKDQGFETSIRTIQRDLIKYSTVFPINCREDTSKTKFWYFIKDSYPFDIPEMSPLSAFTFSLAESFLKLMLPVAITRQLDPHFRSAKNFLEKLQGPSWVKWSEKIREDVGIMEKYAEEKYTYIYCGLVRFYYIYYNNYILL